jgi:HTH-type transcriptional regulator/antitoxin HigA
MTRSVNDIVVSTRPVPARVLGYELEERNISLRKFSKDSGIELSVLKDLQKEKARITPEIAEKIEKVLNIPADFWLKFQKSYDEWPEKRRQWELAHPGWDKDDVEEHNEVVFDGAYDENRLLTTIKNFITASGLNLNHCKITFQAAAV